MIAAHDVRGGYGRLQVLKGVTIGVEAGELVAIIGANGAGKSTLLRCIQGVMAPTGGRVSIGGIDAAGKPVDWAVRSGLTMVPESRDLFPTLSVLDNLVLGAYVHRKEANALAHRTDALRQVYRLFPVLEERGAAVAGSLSGGQQQMLAIGRALMTRPRALMLDEPSLGLAPLMVKQIFGALDALRQQGLAILVVEQNARSVLRLAQRAYVLERGTVIREGSAAELSNDEAIVEAYLGVRPASIDGGAAHGAPADEPR